jgi:hypothetical protein
MKGYKAEHPHSSRGSAGDYTAKNLNGWFEQDCQAELDIRNEARKKDK